MQFCSDVEKEAKGSSLRAGVPVEEVFGHFKSHRAGVIRALTLDFEKFYALCDPEKENLCLYAFADADWDVTFPSLEAPPNFPQPMTGINFCREGMKQDEWLDLVAMHSDSWLLSVAFFLGTSHFRFNKPQREHLFDLINDLPTISEVVRGFAEKRKGENANSSVSDNISSNL